MESISKTTPNYMKYIEKHVLKNYLIWKFEKLYQIIGKLMKTLNEKGIISGNLEET